MTKIMIEISDDDYESIKRGMRYKDTIASIMQQIENAEPVSSSSEEPNKCGTWRYYEGMLYCSQCGAEFYDEIMEYTGDEVPKYCPQCGQPKMQEVGE